MARSMRGPVLSARAVVLLVVVLALAGTACKKVEPAAPPSRPASGGSVQSNGPSLPPPSPTLAGNGSSGSQSGAEVGEDDAKVFAYAITDAGSLAAELASVAAAVAKIQSDAYAHDVNAAEADAKILLDEAAMLGTDAGQAEDHQKPLDPSDDTLVKARGDAIDAFGLTADYANTLTDFAKAAESLSIGDLASVAQQAASLAGSSDDLSKAYADLGAELEAWAKANPAAAAAALAKYP